MKRNCFQTVLTTRTYTPINENPSPRATGDHPRGPRGVHYLPPFSITEARDSSDERSRNNQTSSHLYLSIYLSSLSLSLSLSLDIVGRVITLYPAGAVYII
jgi:hypothetical protein